MIKSDLATQVVEASSSNYTQGRNGYGVCKITPHHMAGILSAEQCGYIFQDPNRQASSNYGIGNDGEIACYVGEENRAWTSGNRENDYQAITIEVSNCEMGGDWAVSDAAWNSLVNLCVDICKRYNFRLNYTGDKYGSLTRHNMFQNTNCPGPYMQDRFPGLAEEVNRILDGEEPGPTPPPTPTPSYDPVVLDYQQSWNKTYGDRYGYILEDGIYGPQTENSKRKVYLKRGMKNHLVGWCQCRLKYHKGYDLGTSGVNNDGVDDCFGSTTESVVGQFQRDNNLDDDNIIGYNTISLLF